MDYVTLFSKFADLLIALVVGLISGAYSGLIVTRLTQFCQIRRGVWDFVNRLDTLGPCTVSDEKIDDLLYTSSNLLFLGHKNAGFMVTEMHLELRKIVEAHESVREDRSRWLNIARHLPCNYRAIFSLKPNL